MGKVLLRARRAEHDVETSPVGAPAGPSGVAAVELVGVGDPGVVLLPVLVLRGGRVGIAPLPERLDEGVPEVLPLEAQEGLAFGLRDDVDDLFLEPGAMAGRHRVLGRGRSGGQRRQHAGGCQPRRGPHRGVGAGATVTGRPSS